MPHETEILFNEPGIQYQGVNDASGSTGAYPVQGLIVGQFKRGRLDKPMIIHRDNIKAMLGYDPQNPCYTAVQDVLGSGVPNVQVLRLGDGGYDGPDWNPGNGGGGNGGNPPDNGDGEDTPEQPSLVVALESLTIEAFYIENQDIPKLLPEYQNLEDMEGHVCNRSQFGVHINNMRVGYINMNNSTLGQPYPQNNDNNVPKAISQESFWTGSSTARYSRIDITREQAIDLASLSNGSNLEIFLAQTMFNIHRDITWVRFSVRTDDGGLHKLFDQLIQLGQYYVFDILNPEKGITESVETQMPSDDIILYADEVRAKWGGMDYRNIPQNLEINPANYSTIDFDINIVPPKPDGSVPITYELIGDYSDMYMEGATLHLNESSYYNKRIVSINITIGSGIYSIKQFLKFELSTIPIDFTASVAYKEEGAWKALETGTIIPNDSLKFLVNVEEIIFGDKVTAIGNNCLSVSSNSYMQLSKVTLPSNLLTIGTKSLGSLEYLESLVLPEGLQSMGDGCVSRLGYYVDHYNPWEGATLSIPKSLKVIPRDCFNNWSTPSRTLNFRDTNLTTIGYSFNSLQPANHSPFTLLLPDTLVDFDGFSYMLLNKVVFGRSINTIRQTAFNYAYDNYGSIVKVSEIIILRSDAMVEPLGVSPMGGIGFHENRLLKVPFNLVADYQNSAQWAKLVSSANITAINPDDFE